MASRAICFSGKSLMRSHARIQRLVDGRQAYVYCRHRTGRGVPDIVFGGWGRMNGSARPCACAFCFHHEYTSTEGRSEA